MSSGGARSLGLLAAALLLLTGAGVEREAPRTSVAEIQETYRDSFEEFLRGRYEAARSGYRYLVSLGAADTRATASLALLLRDLGKPNEAAAHWLKATLIAPKDPFLWNQRAWNYLALGRFKEARDCFRKAMENAERPDDAAESAFGLGLADSLDDNPKTAIPSLRAAADRSPYLRPAAAAELARIHVRRRRYAQSLPFFTMSLEQDDTQLDVLRDLGRVYEKTGQTKAAWQACKLVLDMDPDDAKAMERARDLEEYIKGRPEDSMPVLRLARPMFRGLQRGAARDQESPPVRVAMFTGEDGRPRHLTRFQMMGSTTTLLWDVRLDDSVVEPAPPFRQWEVVFRNDNRVIEIRDMSRNIVYVTKQPFRLVPETPGYTVLIKSPELTDIRGVDISDRELRGVVEVIPTFKGFHVVNELPLEQYLLPVVAQALPRGSAPDAYKAISVMTRTKVRSLLGRGRKNAENTDFPDSYADLEYLGLSRERPAATRAVRETRGVGMSLPRGFGLEHHRSCGWATAAGIQDRDPWGSMLTSVLALEKLVHHYPDERLFHQAAALVPESWNRWVQVLDARVLRKRVDRVKKIGPLTNVRALRRDRTGRVVALEITGARGRLELSGPKAIRGVLAPGSLRSSLFTLQPLYKGRRLRRLVVWGGGTGHGRGVCVAGVLGQAHLGRDYCQILRHYFTEKVHVSRCPRPKAGPKPKRPSKRRSLRPARKKPSRRRPRRRRRSR